MSSQLDRSAIGVRYLLGELSAEEEQSFEKEYFANDELFEDLQITEAEVIDAYVANELDDQPRKHLEQRLAISPRLQQRLSFARTFAESRRRPHSKVVPDRVPHPWWTKLIAIPFAAQPVSRWALVATAIAVLAVAAAVVQTVRLRTESQRLTAERTKLERQRAELARLSAEERDRTASELREAQLRYQRAEELVKALQQPPGEKSPATPTLASIVLMPGSLRSADDVKELPLTSGTSEVRLQLVLLSIDYRTYRVTINSRDKEIRRSNVRPAANKTIVLRVPASQLPPGTYTVSVSGVTPTGDIEPVSNYTFRVTPGTK